MDSSDGKHAHSHEHDKPCACDHPHDHGHSHQHHHALGLGRRWFLTVVIVVGLLFLLRPFILTQMFVRITSYSVSSSYKDAVRISKKIIAIDKDNIKGWTSLGFAYMDSSQVNAAIPVFEKVLELNPADKGAASFELGEAYYAKGDYRKTIEYFERVRSAGPYAATSLEADILKYRHGTLGFRSLNSMKILYKELIDSYQHMDNSIKAQEVQNEYDIYKNKHSQVLF